MKIMATFDGSACSEVTLPHLAAMARLPDAEFILCCVAIDELAPRYEGDAVAVAGDGAPPERSEDEGERYLRELVCRLPVGPHYVIEAFAARDAASAIILRALKERPDVIVMATHGRTGMLHIMFGDVAEQVVLSRVAPVLLVHPDGLKSEWQCMGSTGRAAVAAGTGAAS